MQCSYICLVAGSDLMFTNTASKGGYAPTLFTQCRIQASENPLLGNRVNGVRGGLWACEVFYVRANQPQVPKSLSASSAISSP
jgi:hypothetical protein